VNAAAARVGARGGGLRRLLGLGGVVCGLGLVHPAPVRADTQVRAPTSDISVTGTWGGGSGGCTALGSKWSCINDYADLTPTGYVACGAGAPCTSRYGFTTPAITSSSVTSVSIEFTAGEGSGGVNNATACLIVGGTDFCQGTHDPSTTYAAFQEVWANNPCTSAAWTEAQVEGTAGSCNLTAMGLFTDDISPQPRFASMQMTVTFVATTTTTTSPTTTTTLAGASAPPRRLM
jgi:hypothetical protein